MASTQEAAKQAPSEAFRVWYKLDIEGTSERVGAISGMTTGNIMFELQEAILKKESCDEFFPKISASQLFIYVLNQDDFLKANEMVVANTFETPLIVRSTVVSENKPPRSTDSHITVCQNSKLEFTSLRYRNEEIKYSKEPSILYDDHMSTSRANANQNFVSWDDFQEDVQKQFDEAALNIAISLINRKDEDWKKIDSLTSIGNQRAEMVLQQVMYPVFALVLIAAAVDREPHIKQCSYFANQEATSSLFVTRDKQQKKHSALPDGGLKLTTSDPLVTMELKEGGDHDEHDIAKSTLFACLTGQRLIHCGAEGCQLPFLIGSGTDVLLYVVKFDDDKDDLRPALKSVYNKQMNLLIQHERLQLFHDFVTLVGKLKKKLMDEAVNMENLVLDQRIKALGTLTTRDNKDDKGKSDRKRQRSQSSRTQDKQEPNVSTHYSDQINAMKAALQVYGHALHVYYPFTKSSRANHNESPFFFRGSFRGPRAAFFKIWRLGDKNVDQDDIRDEVEFLRAAKDVGVSVPHILEEGSCIIEDTTFFVLAMQDAGLFHECDSFYELALYSRSLVNNMMKLHNAGILHCDIKPDNVAWDTVRKQVIILDFGLAQRMERAKCWNGTRGFAAPEVERGEGPNTCTSDAYSVGATIQYFVDKLLLRNKQDNFGIGDTALGLLDPDCSKRFTLDKVYKRLSSAVPPLLEQGNKVIRKKRKLQGPKTPETIDITTRKDSNEANSKKDSDRSASNYVGKSIAVTRDRKSNFGEARSHAYGGASRKTLR